ncbi:DUF5615 family PIN-like protein [Sphingomonas sp. RB56-2]|uniref:DUF5615 family PIN-like protein n=1 Tax=Sphingomonas brevis TaxID=2908206 RepID=A0ABT0SCD2_9SPHN|nr:DUF5615 family PIN-like protein [Sphingomonas brevis]MCL6741802.1 DUF5615 family PIN-like protein [Sphingomonas brevis]
MATAAIKLLLFLDNNVPDSIGRYLQGRGHSVLRQRFHIPADSPDHLVAMTAMKAGRILVTIDKDFNAQRFQQGKFATLSRIALSGPSHTLLDAVKEHAHLIEYQWSHIQKTGGVRMVAHVKAGDFRFRA